MFTTPFRGSTAVAAGLLTAGELRGPRFRRLYQDVHVATHVDVDLALLAAAAFVLVDGRDVVGGWAAAELLDASCGPPGAPAEIIVPGRRRAQARLLVREAVIPAAETTTVGAVTVTDERRTAFDLGRRPPLVEAVVAIDALSRVGEFAPAELIRFGCDHLGARGTGLLRAAVRLADPLSGSPMETRIRLALHRGGQPAPVLQHPVGPFALDLSYPDQLLAVECDGREHRTAERALHDLRREAYLTGSAGTCCGSGPGTYSDVRGGWPSRCVANSSAAVRTRHDRRQPHRIALAGTRACGSRRSTSA